MSHMRKHWHFRQVFCCPLLLFFWVWHVSLRLGISLFLFQEYFKNEFTSGDGKKGSYPFILCVHVCVCISFLYACMTIWVTGVALYRHEFIWLSPRVHCLRPYLSVSLTSLWVTMWEQEMVYGGVVFLKLESVPCSPFQHSLLLHKRSKWIWSSLSCFTCATGNMTWVTEAHKHVWGHFSWIGYKNEENGILPWSKLCPDFKAIGNGVTCTAKYFIWKLENKHKIVMMGWTSYFSLYNLLHYITWHV